jgi:hypothetical protein
VYFAASLLALEASSVADEIAIIPGDVALHRAGALHALIVERRDGDDWRGDVTAQAEFESSDALVATVDANGVVRAVGNGEATITAKLADRSVTTPVSVSGTEAPYAQSFRNHVQPVLFKMGCNTGACHGAAAGKNGFKLSLRGFDHDWDHKALTRQANGRRLSPGDPEQSLMLLKPVMDVPHAGGERFGKDSEAYRILVEWIESGAPAASSNDPVVEDLEVMPKSVTLDNGASQQILVRAKYSDGTYEDVTRWVSFGTTDDAVATVDEQGKVTITGSGGASITMYYASKVSSARIIVPRETPVDSTLFANAARRNYIDELVLRQLERLQIAPAAEAGDTAFIRRATLDTIGMLPTPEEVSAFVLDPDTEKRDRLIDRLLNRPEFVDYWSYKWSDVLLLSSKNLPRREELNAFYRYIRNNVEANTPWDAFVQDILTAQGSTLDNGAANFFTMHKETVDLTETTSQTFLGFSITCARCHNHPLEKWTQDDYYGMANLFSRVTFKNGRRGNDTEVITAAFGDVIHPRLGAPVEPQPLDGDPIALNAAVDRRDYLADWITSPENPYFTKSIVNRVWKNFMGRGLVEPEDDLRLTNPPSNPDLLDALAQDLVEHDYDLKHLMRTIMQSAAYRRSSAPSDPALPDDKHYSQYIVRRLSAEVILDAYAQVTGVPTKFDGYPEGFRALQLPDSQVGSYFLEAFGRPERNQACSCERTEDSSVAQTLHMANGDTLNGKLRDDRSIVATLMNQQVDDEEALNTIYLRALSRMPLPEEREEALTILAAVPKEGPECEAERRAALEDVTWAVLSGKEFLFTH